MTLKRLKEALANHDENQPVAFHDADGAFSPYVEISDDSDEAGNDLIRITLCAEIPECACADGGTCDQVHEDERSK